jgi:glycosyltransferase involved in cell wall biosynthesis
VGDGEEAELVRQLVEQKGLSANVIFAGVRNDIPKLMSAMDVLLLPSLYEGMPNVVIEAQANGLPCVISDTITREANVTGLVSFLPITEGAAPWCAGITAALDKGRLSTGAIMVEKGYDIESVCRKFEELCLLM